jgi:hypothetical protein
LKMTKASGSSLPPKRSTKSYKRRGVLSRDSAAPTNHENVTTTGTNRETQARSTISGARRHHLESKPTSKSNGMQVQSGPIIVALRACDRRKASANGTPTPTFALCTSRLRPQGSSVGASALWAVGPQMRKGQKALVQVQRIVVRDTRVWLADGFKKHDNVWGPSDEAEH